MMPRSFSIIAALALIGVVHTAGPAQAKRLGTERFLQNWDADHDGTLSLDEVKWVALVEKLFRAADKDHDGTLDRKELNSRAGTFLLRLFGPRQGPLL